MEFAKGDIVRFKTGSPILMLVVDPNRKRSIGDGKKITVIECKWYEPMSRLAKDAGFIHALFEPYEIEKVDSQ